MTPKHMIIVRQVCHCTTYYEILLSPRYFTTLQGAHAKGKKKKMPAIKQVRANDFGEGTFDNNYDDDMDDFM